jgi:hypothetical protein
MAPEGFRSAPVRPQADYFSQNLREFVLHYDARSSQSSRTAQPKGVSEHQKRQPRQRRSLINLEIAQRLTL